MIKKTGAKTCRPGGPGVPSPTDRCGQSGQLFSLGFSSEAARDNVWVLQLDARFVGEPAGVEACAGQCGAAWIGYTGP